MKDDPPTDELVTFVIQGPTIPVSRYAVEITIASIRAFFPTSCVIVSTWHGQPTHNLTADDVILSEDPGPITDGSSTVLNNINRQIVSTRAGLRRVRTPFAAKVRSDALITGRGFVTLATAFPFRRTQGRMFERRIVIPREFTRSPRSLVPMAYHPSDLFHFGLTSDLQFYWDAPLIEADRLKAFILDKPPKHWFSMFDNFRYTTEQYLFLSALARKELHPDLTHYSEIDDRITEQSEYLLFNNFIPCEGSVLGVQHIKFQSRAQRSLAEDCLGLREFASWYVEQAAGRSPVGSLGSTTPHLSPMLRAERLARELVKKSNFLRSLYSGRYLSR